MNSNFWGLFMRINLEGSVFFFSLPSLTDFFKIIEGNGNEKNVRIS